MCGIFHTELHLNSSESSASANFEHAPNVWRMTRVKPLSSCRKSSFAPRCSFLLSGKLAIVYSFGSSVFGTIFRKYAINRILQFTWLLNGPRESQQNDKNRNKKTQETNRKDRNEKSEDDNNMA